MAPEGRIDRLTIRNRPDALPVLHQSWQKLLFMHWRLPPESLRPHIPPQLELDTFDGSAWIAVTPFIVRHTRPVFLPAIPWLSDFNEVNVRTYVYFKGVPGVWFFSLDTDSLSAVLGASAAFMLPYKYAQMSFREEADRIFYTSSRGGESGQPTALEATWRRGGMIGEAQPESLEFFLVERYCLYAVDARHQVYRARIHHDPWKLQKAELISLRSTMIESQGLPDPAGDPLLHYSERRDVSVWPLKRVS